MKKELLINKLSSVYGIGKSLIFNILKKVGLNKRKKVTHIKKKQTNFLIKTTKKIILGKDLKDEIYKILEFSNKIKTYRSIRHRLHYPCRGQRTHTNAKTVKKLQRQNLINIKQNG